MAKKKLKVEYLPLDELRHHKKNAKLHHDEAMMNSIMRFDFADPVLYNQHPDANFIVAGHGRCTALARLRDERGDPPENISVDAKGRWLVPVVKLSLPPGEAEAFLLAHNKIGEVGDPDLGAWDMDLLSAVVGDMQLLDTNLEGLGWDAGELDEIALGGVLKGPPGSGGGDDPPPNKADELQEKWGTELGQMWKCGEHRIICGDCTDQAVVDLVMGGEKADLCLTDPPYGIGFKYDEHDDNRDEWFILIDTVMPIIRTTANFCVVQSCGIDRIGWWYANHHPDWPICWYKGSPGHLSKIGFNDWEMILTWGKPPSQMHDYFQTACGFSDGHGHPCPKPVAWAEWIVERGAVVSGTVFDPFLGSGTTMIACERLNRRCRGIELSPAYVAVCLERWHLETGLDPELLT